MRRVEMADAVTWGEFNEERFEHEVLAALRTGRRTFPHRPFDFVADTVLDCPAHRVTAGVLVLRCYAFVLDGPWDVRVWVETPRDECLRRELDRDSPALGDPAVVAWRDVWQPREDAYISAMRPQERADLIVDGHRAGG